MTTIIVKDGIAVYANAELREEGAYSNGRFDPSTRTDNATVVEIEHLPDLFMIGRYTWDGTKLEPTAEYAEEIKRDLLLAQIVALESQQTTRMLREAALDINGGKELLADINAQIEALRAQLPAE